MRSHLVFKSVVTALLCAALLFSALPAAAGSKGYAQPREDPSAAMVADLLVVRPVGLAATICGSVLTVGTLPFSIWGGKEQVGKVAQHLVAEPARYTFRRPVGDFESQSP